jgi:hypothetical protein
LDAIGRPLTEPAKPIEKAGGEFSRESLQAGAAPLPESQEKRSSNDASSVPTSSIVVRAVGAIVVAIIAIFAVIGVTELDDEFKKRQTRNNTAGVAVNQSDLPKSGFFSLRELFSTGPYAGHNKYSLGAILRQVQNALKNRGFYNGEIDGEAGPATQKAILGWQRHLGVVPNGRLDSATLTPLGLNP